MNSQSCVVAWAGTSRTRILFSLLLFLACLLLVNANITAQAMKSGNAGVVTMSADELNDDDLIPVPDENVHVIRTMPLGMPAFFYQNAPTVADPASVYSSVDSLFSGSAFAPAGQANTPAITRLLADDLTLIGTPPFSIGRFSFSMCNLNAAAVSARPRVRFYLNNAGTPGTLITGFSFNPISVAAGSCTSLFANVAPFSVTSNNIWAGMLFDNSTATATATQIDSFAMGIFATPDLGSSADVYYRTTSAPAAGASFLGNNPGPGATSNFAGAPLANFGWDLRAVGTIATITRDFPDTQVTSGNVQWTVTLTGSTITGLTASNFALATTGTIAGAAISSVTANNLTSPNTPNSTNWTVIATSGTGTGTIGLNWANVTGLNTNVSNTLPFAGQTYTILGPTASGVSVSGRVLTHDGRPIRFARLTLSSFTGETLETHSDERGNFEFEENVAPGETYSLTVAAKRTLSLSRQGLSA